MYYMKKEDVYTNYLKKKVYVYYKKEEEKDRLKNVYCIEKGN
jgi:hypothetical protein